MMMVDLVSTKCDDIKMAVFTDDFSAAGKLKSLLQWWTRLLELGPNLVTSLNPQNRGLSQSLKNMQLEKNFSKITNSGKRFLGSVIGTFAFKKRYVDEIGHNGYLKLKYRVRLLK